MCFSATMHGGRRDASSMTRTEVLTDEMWAWIEPVLPALKGSMGRPMRQHRPLVGGAIYRYRTGIAWRDLPAEFGPGRRYGNGTTASPPMAPGTRSLRRCRPRPTPVARSTGGSASTPPSPGSTSTGRQLRGPTRSQPRTQGAPSNDKDFRHRRVDEPDDHAIGRSRGGLTTKTGPLRNVGLPVGPQAASATGLDRARRSASRTTRPDPL
jgi:hypothetical protein